MCKTITSNCSYSTHNLPANELNNIKSTYLNQDKQCAIVDSHSIHLGRRGVMDSGIFWIVINIRELEIDVFYHATDSKQN